MGLAYTINKAKNQQKGKGGKPVVKLPRNPEESESPKPRLKLVRDETGAIIRVPKLRPWQNPKRLDRKEAPLCPDGEPAYWGGISREDLDRMQGLLDPKGHVMCPRINLKWGDNEWDAAKKFWMVTLEPQETTLPRCPRKQHSLPRHGAVTKRLWREARGNAEWLERQAAHYLLIFDHANARYFDEPEFTLMKVVCNLRRYFGMSQDQTIMLMTSLFNPKTDLPWSPEGIALAWELVADYTPGLGLTDPGAIADQKRLELEDEVTELLAYTRSGGRVLTEEFYELLKEWNPDLEDKKGLVSKAVKRVTGIEATGYREGVCYPGFHLPTAEELVDTQHHAGLDLSTITVPRRPINVESLIPLNTLVSACLRAS